ncbi:MAG: hypothetical protein EU530_04575 [Promethearchaeota archaeon]|nr:MAG: hypothetical protein EU530_04575 [Candidatus Lokiarchaeota archaeon]
MSTEKARKNSNNLNDLEPENKTKTIRWIAFFFLITIYSAGYFVLMNLEQIPELDGLEGWLKIVIYVFIMVIFFGPFIPIKRRGGKRVSIVNSLVRLMEGPKRRQYNAKPQSNLNVKYRPPLISSCKKCGFLLTRQMEKCPNCKHTNQYYVAKD